MRVEIGGHDIHRMYVDDRSASEILYEHFFLRLRTEVRSRPGIRALGAVPSTTQGMMKFPTRAGVAIIVSERANTLEIQMVDQPVTQPQRAENIKKPEDVTGVPRTLAEHKLEVKERTPVESGIMREVTYHSCISNPMLNVDATYKRLVDKAFDRQIGRNLEVYMDDQVIKSHGEQEAIRDIEETFRTLRRINMKLNPKKCTFGVEEKMFLRHTIRNDEIQAYGEKA
ncbi:reverse transcriptase domain-containing protein [Tanacetum coccineum]